MPFHFEPTPLPGVILIKTRLFPDNRGFFSECYKLTDFRAAGIGELFVQDNYSYSVQGVLRGLHYQKEPDAQAKLVMASMGEIFDVAVDIRKGSPTYGQWFGRTLSRENGEMLYIPEGYAHGFCVISPEACVTYKVNREFNLALDRGIVWNDPDVGIDWPVKSPVLSEKDSRLPQLHKADNDFTWQT